MKLLLVMTMLWCTSCAFGHIVRPDGTTLTGVVIGSAHIDTCGPEGIIMPETSSVDGAMVGSCARIDGGSMSSTLATVLGGLVTAAAAYFSTGAVW